MVPVYDDLLGDVDSILGIRDDLGVALHPVFIVTRTWSAGTELGEGDYSDTELQMLPSPRIKEFADDYKIKEGGAIQQGDIMLKMISKQSYPKRSDVDCSVDQQFIEKFYKINDIFYRVIFVWEQHVTWNVHLRRVSDQTRRQ
jgi:hypothetical protein